MTSQEALSVIDDMSRSLVEYRGTKIKDVHAALKGAVDRDWDEARMDIIGPNGNEGLHYPKGEGI
jgi:hypothetical protein